MHSEIVRDVEISQEDFFDYMTDQICSQIAEIRKSPFSRKDLKAGYSHKTRQTDPRTKKTETTRFTVRKFEPPRLLSVSYSKADSRSEVTYAFAPAKKGCTLTYTVDTVYGPGIKEPSGLRGMLAQGKAARQITGAILEAEKDCRKRLKEKEKKKAE